MKLLPHRPGRARTCVSLLAGMTLTVFTCLGAQAQGPSPEPKPSETKQPPQITEVIHLAHVTAQRELNDLQTALRNMVPRLRIYAVPTQNAISISGTAEEIDSAKKLVGELDHPTVAYRVNYTITETDKGKPAGVQHLSLLVVSGERAVAKHGTRVPIVTGTLDKESGGQTSQVQYLDVGLNVDASLDGNRLRSKLEQTSLSDEKPGINIPDPIIRQGFLEATSDLEPGKKLVLGTLDLPGTTRHEEVEATAERVP
jgi:type II secretory pathway component GspD/PulD (secretin)